MVAFLAHVLYRWGGISLPKGNFFVKCHLKNRAENVIKALSFYFGQINELHGVFHLI